MEVQIPSSHRDLLNCPKVATLTTVMPDGQPQTTVVWCNFDGIHILVFIFPLIGGVIDLFQHFSWIVVGALIALVMLSFGGNALVRGMFACKHCKQRELGCPVVQLFNQGKGESCVANKKYLS
jgi:hypothetical protein